MIYDLMPAELIESKHLTESWFYQISWHQVVYHKSDIKSRVHCSSMQVIINKCFLLNPEKKIGTNPSYRFREIAKKRILNSENWRHRAEG